MISIANQSELTQAIGLGIAIKSGEVCWLGINSRSDGDWRCSTLALMIGIGVHAGQSL